MLEAVIFDKDGVLVDTESMIARAIDATIQKFGSKRPYNLADRVKHGGIPAKQTFPILKKDYDLIGGLDEMIVHYQEFYTKLIQDDGVIVFPGVREFLQDLSDYSIKCAIGTGSPKFRTDMTIGGLDSFFEAIVTSDDVENPKPAPDTFLLGAKKLGVEPSECVVIGDSVNDANGARSAGMKFIFRSSLAPKDVLDFEPEMTVESLSELNTQKLKELFL